MPCPHGELLTWPAGEQPSVHIPVGPEQISLEFLVDTGAQISALDKQQVEQLRVKLSRKTINTVGVTGVAEKLPLARTQLWLPGEKRVMAVEGALSPSLVRDLTYWQASNGICPVTGCGLLGAEKQKALCEAFADRSCTTAIWNGLSQLRMTCGWSPALCQGRTVPWRSAAPGSRAALAAPAPGDNRRGPVVAGYGSQGLDSACPGPLWSE